MDYSDNGFKSRKMIMAYISIGLITLGFLAIGKWPALAVAYGEFIMGLLAATTIFTGANTAIKWMAHKAHVNGQLTDETDSIDVSSEEEPEEPKTK